MRLGNSIKTLTKALRKTNAQNIEAYCSPSSHPWEAKWGVSFDGKLGRGCITHQFASREEAQKFVDEYKP